MTQNLEKKVSDGNDKSKFSYWKIVFKPFIYTFVITLIIHLGSTYINTFDKMWSRRKIPYDIKWEWILNLEMRSLRFKTSLNKENGYISNLLQKGHLLIYERAKRKIPYNDPFWVEFWEVASFPAARKQKIKYSEEVRKEILENLKIIAANKSKVESFNNFDRYILVGQIYYRVVNKVKYIDKNIISNFENNILNASRPIIEDFFKSNFNFYQYKDDISRSYVKKIPFQFILELLYIYMNSIILDKNKTCDVELKELVLDQSEKYILHDKNLGSLKEKIDEALNIYHRQYSEYCIGNR